MRAHRNPNPRSLAEIGNTELRTWLARLADAGIAPEALVAAAMALDAIDDAEESKRDDDGLPPSWSACDELDAAIDDAIDDREGPSLLRVDEILAAKEALAVLVPQG